MKKLLLLAALAAGTVSPPIAGQELARRIQEVDDGTVRMSFATKPEVEICDQGIRIGEDRHLMWRTRGWGDEGPSNCRVGSAEVEMRVRRGSVREVDLLLEPEDRTAGAVELGEVPAREAVDFFLAVARGEVGTHSEEDAVFPVVIADVDEVWRDLMTIARDPSLDEDVRTASLFWVGQEAADAVTEGIADVALDEGEDQDVRDAAVFALSQRPAVEGVPILMDVARNAKSGDTRRSAMFWLAQSEDERVYAFFEEVLLGRRGGG